MTRTASTPYGLPAVTHSAPNRNAQTGRETRRAARRPDHQTYGTQANVISPPAQVPAWKYRMNPLNGSARPSENAAHRAAPYSRESRYAPTAAMTRNWVFTTVAAVGRWSIWVTSR